MARLENIFNLPQPEYYDCYVERYQSNFQTLRIRVERFHEHPLPSHNIVELVFTSVLYFEGVFNWTNANICRASQSDLLKMLYASKILEPHHDEDEVDETLSTYALFRVRTSNGAVVQWIASVEDYTSNIIG